MGRYNPHAPFIVGPEWVPIREEDIVYSPAVNTVERGHQFTTLAAHSVAQTRFYINEFPPGAEDALGQVYMAAIYKAGAEDLSGPIRSVIIPCDNGGITGTGASLANGATSVADALAVNSDGKAVRLTLPTSPDRVSMFFNADDYAPLLDGKRILGVRLLYAVNVDLSGENATFSSLFTLENNAGSFLVYIGAEDRDTEFSVVDFGEINHFWTTTSPATTPTRMPWTFAGLQQFEASNSNRIFILFKVNAVTGTLELDLNYAALEVFYCEEQRLIVGGRAFGVSSSSLVSVQPYVYQTNSLSLRGLIGPGGLPAFVIDPILQAGQYTMTLSSPELGDLGGFKPIAASTYPKTNALRELYQIPTHPLVEVNIPKPLSGNIGNVFTKGSGRIIPQLSLHLSGSAETLNEPHAYGRQAAAQVYDNTKASQEINDSWPAATLQYPQVRWYCRRFGDTSSALRLIGGTPTITGAGIEVQITPAEWDALPEIIDGWKEVTLRFPTPPTMGNVVGNPRWDWISPGELSMSRWEVLGAIAPAISGTTGNLQSLVATHQRLGDATYEPSDTFTPANANAEWEPGYVPFVSTPTMDLATDLILIFSTDPLPVTGFGISQQMQAISGIGLDCGVPPCCIPTGIQYNRLTWGLPPNTSFARDSFSRVVVDGWGNADVGDAYTLIGTAANFDVNGSIGTIAPGTLNVERTATLSLNPDVDVTVDTSVVSLTTIAPGSAGQYGVVTRLTDNSNYYLARVSYLNSDKNAFSITFGVVKKVGGVLTTLGGVSPPIGAGIGTALKIRFVAEDNRLKAKVWGISEPEPASWMIEVIDSDHTTGRSGVLVERFIGGVDTIGFDNLVVTPPRPWFGNYELQRKDATEPEYKTIMLATSPAVTGFNDYEARTDTISTYRIRQTNLYDFAGAWSPEITGFTPAPGITGGCVDEGHILIFTSNWSQSGAYNLAYSSVWESQVEEEFNFAEAGAVQLQAMYNRDYFTAFRPTERGGEQFQRTLLVQAAAIAPETLANFTSLRDMAWADVPYICVRDEDGNRWLATVAVPSGRVLRGRRLYMAPINIVEVTNTPSQGDAPIP